MIKLIIFDVNGVLLNKEGFGKYFEKEYERFLKMHNATELKASENQWKKVASKIHAGEITLRQARLKQMERMGIDKKYISEYEAIDDRQVKLVRPMELNERKVLILLKKRGYKLAVLTDTLHPKLTIKRKMAALGIDKILDGVFSSSEIGHQKPHRKAYETVLKFFKVRPDETVFVGHDDDEMLGAKRLGIVTVSYRQSRKGDFFIHSFTELSKLVDSINKSQAF